MYYEGFVEDVQYFNWEESEYGNTINPKQIESISALMRRIQSP